jgi:hypothetical protein
VAHHRAPARPRRVIAARQTTSSGLARTVHEVTPWDRRAARPAGTVPASPPAVP